MKKETQAKTQSKKPTAKKPKKQNKAVKWIVIGAIAAAVVVAAIIVLPKVFGQKEQSTKITTYNVTEVTYGNISQTVSGSGTLTPITSKTLTATKGGEVEKVNFTVGDEVAKNDKIAVINGETITAPCDGILIELPISVGDEVARGGSIATMMGKDGFTMGIAAISLLVGGIGIMNIMLVSVSERTREIGIRKAVGAKRRHILAQFLCEACILSVLGGIIGLLLSFGAVEIYKAAASAAVSLNWSVGFAAIGFCAVIGILFGGYPAAKASRLQPIEALRAE